MVVAKNSVNSIAVEKKKKIKQEQGMMSSWRYYKFDLMVRGKVLFLVCLKESLARKISCLLSLARSSPRNVYLNLLGRANFH